MGLHRAGLAGLGTGSCDRFAGWPRSPARLALLVLAWLIALAAVAPGYAPPPPAPPQIAVRDAAGTVVGHADDNDMYLYRVIDQRLRHGENYYRVAVEEQRAHGYPVVPGLTIRLPTLAVAASLFGDSGMIVLGMLLVAAMLLAMHRRLAREPGAAERAPLALALLLTGILCGLDHRFNVLHEVWAAQLMALAFALHRPGGETELRRWGWSWAIAAVALALRELVLPFVLLMAATALWERRRIEAAAWGTLIGLFGLTLLVHLHFAAAEVHPGDPVSQSWIALRGLAGLLYKVNNSTLLSLLPLWLSGPFVVLALFGWAGLNTPMGRFGFLLCAGYGLAFMVAGRENNFYWGLLIAPVLFMGAAFAPPALRSLWRSAGLGGPGRRIAHA